MRRFLFLAFSLQIFAAPVAAQFVAPGGAIPAVANITGKHGELWKSDVSIRNVGTAETSVTLLLLPEITAEGAAFEPQVSDPVIIPGNGQVTLVNVVSTVFGLSQSKGGLQVFSNDGGSVALGSRTYTDAEGGGTYGLNVYGLLIVNNEAWIANVQNDGFFRTNVGIYLPINPPSGESYVFTIVVTDNQGQEVSSGSVIFDEGGLIQKELEYFGVTDPLFDGSITIRSNAQDVPWYAYATIIDNSTNDSVFRAAMGQQ